MDKRLGFLAFIFPVVSENEKRLNLEIMKTLFLLILLAFILKITGIVEEKDLRIPNMRGIMMARKKPMQVIPPVDIAPNTQTEKFEKPAAKGACKMVDASDLDQLIDLLHNEAKVI